MNPYGKAKRLVRLASDPRTPEKEAFAAAMAACKIISEHDLLATNPLEDITDKIPEDVRESIESVSSAFQHLTDPAFVASLKKAAKALLKKRRY